VRRVDGDVKRVAVFAPMGTVDHQTGILNAARAFADAGYAVDFWTVRNRRYDLPSFASPNVRLRVLPKSFDAEPEPRWAVTLWFAAWMLLTFRRPPRLVFAGGIRGLFAAWLLQRTRKVEVVNYQTELYVGHKLDTRAARLVKAVERSAAQASVLTIEHDPARKVLLMADLGLAPERIAIVPNAPFGPARAAPSTFLHERLGLAPGARIALSPGTLTPSFVPDRVVAEAQQVAPPWRVVVHSAQPRSTGEPYIADLVARDTAGRVSFSLAPIPYADIDRLLGSAAVGLALYATDLGENTSTVGLASGKLSHFLKLGIPVVVSPLPGLADFVLAHRVGLVLEREGQLPELLAAIDADAAGYRERALACFDRFLAYEAAFAQVLAVTDPIAESR
jgi:glycosyltransferase involved in cell wall biosynthesis